MSERMIPFIRSAGDPIQLIGGKTSSPPLGSDPQEVLTLQVSQPELCPS